MKIGVVASLLLVGASTASAAPLADAYNWFLSCPDTCKQDRFKGIPRERCVADCLKQRPAMRPAPQTKPKKASTKRKANTRKKRK